MKTESETVVKSDTPFCSRLPIKKTNSMPSLKARDLGKGIGCTSGRSLMCCSVNKCHMMRFYKGLCHGIWHKSDGLLLKIIFSRTRARSQVVHIIGLLRYCWYEPVWRLTDCCTSNFLFKGHQICFYVGGWANVLMNLIHPIPDKSNLLIFEKKS